MEKHRGISLRYKLLALLSLLPIVFLALYLVMATNLFADDKKAYIYDSSVFMASSLSTQIKMETNSYRRTAAPIFEAIEFTDFKFSPRSKSFFESQKNIEHLRDLKNACLISDEQERKMV